MGLGLVDKPHLQRFKTRLDAIIPKILKDTEANWNSQAQLVSDANTIYVYTDHDHNPDTGDPIPALKVGDGASYLIDMPFITDNTSMLMNHIDDLTIHTNTTEKTFWNGKLSCDESQILEDEILVLTTE